VPSTSNECLTAPQPQTDPVFLTNENLDGALTFRCGARRPGFVCVTGVSWDADAGSPRCAAGHPMARYTHPTRLDASVGSMKRPEATAAGYGPMAGGGAPGAAQSNCIDYTEPKRGVR
jgi:hypothetical protein